MEPIRRALVVGAGAVGAAIASLIRAADPGAVALCATGSRRARCAADGFVVNGVRTDFALADPDVDGPFGLAIVAVKNHQLGEAIRDMRPFVGPGTLVLSLLNGVTSEAALAAEFGAEKVPLGLIIRIDALRNGNRVDFPSPGEIRFGDPRNVPGAWSGRVSRIAEFFARTGVPFSVPEDMTRALWFKFMFNVAVNQWSAVLRAPYRVFHEVPEARALLRDAMLEVVAVSRALGTGLAERDVDGVLAMLDGQGPEGRTSMLQDVDARRKTEVEAFAGTMIDLGRDLGIPVPVNRILFGMLRTIEAAYPA